MNDTRLAAKSHLSENVRIAAKSCVVAETEGFEPKGPGPAGAVIARGAPLRGVAARNGIEGSNLRHAHSIWRRERNWHPTFSHRNWNDFAPVRNQTTPEHNHWHRFDSELAWAALRLRARIGLACGRTGATHPILYLSVLLTKGSRLSLSLGARLNRVELG